MFKIVLVSMLFLGMVYANCDNGQTECGESACCPEGYVMRIFLFFANLF
jgi:hypothetical protein